MLTSPTYAFFFCLLYKGLELRHPCTLHVPNQPSNSWEFFMCIIVQVQTRRISLQDSILYMSRHSVEIQVDHLVNPHIDGQQTQTAIQSSDFFSCHGAKSSIAGACIC
eukprot:TRINITY_DN5558_c0_g1_i12.p1 TRINITY_DN5558_c0_g1~~TRINITY_DN5558_c0_g1_i12.p1  ORF type:complete len:108 (+),score=3.87 TRINITY_DN5558_c0_g1_i12:1222-1545(+)